MNKVLFARETLTTFVDKLDKEILKIWYDHIPSSINHPLFTKSARISSIGEELLDHLMEHNTRAAKRLRASLIYYGYKLIAPHNQIDEDKLLIASSSIEFVHTGLLIHDDFQDQDSIRRGKATTHKHYENYHDKNLKSEYKEHFGASMAINVGDYALTLGYQTLLKSGFDPLVTIEALDYLFQGISQTLYGQSFDIILENSETFTEQDIYDLHHSKTWIYTYLTPLLVWITLAGGSEKIKNKLIEFALPCGIAFQLQDDVIGLFGDEEKTGKSAYSDIKEGKKTLLMLKTIELCTPQEREIITELWGRGDLTAEQAEFVRSVVKNSGALDYSYKKATEFALQAQKVIQEIAENDKDGVFNTEVLDYLEGIAEYMAVRRDF